MILNDTIPSAIYGSLPDTLGAFGHSGQEDAEIADPCWSPTALSLSFVSLA